MHLFELISTAVATRLQKSDMLRFCSTNIAPCWEEY